MISFAVGVKNPKYKWEVLALFATNCACSTYQ